MNANLRGVRTPTLSPGDVRDRIREEHGRIRRSLMDLQALARGVTLDEDLAGALRANLRCFVVEFSLHLDLEEEILMPVVEQLDAWGPQRAAAMRVEHAEQRQLLRHMFERGSHREDPLGLAEEVDALVLRMFHDMRSEEAELIHDDVLRDDIVAIDQTCG